MVVILFPGFDFCLSQFTGGCITMENEATQKQGFANMVLMYPALPDLHGDFEIIPQNYKIQTGYTNIILPFAARAGSNR